MNTFFCVCVCVGVRVFAAGVFVAGWCALCAKSQKEDEINVIYFLGALRVM